MSKIKSFVTGSPDATFLVQVDFYKVSGDRSDFYSFEPSLTRQEFAEECDINTIMQRYEASGVISHVNRATPMYLDTTDYPDLQGAMDQYREASLAFAALPAKVRKEFDNDPQLFVDFASDSENLDRMREWGLAPPKPIEAAPIRVEVSNPVPLAPDSMVAPAPSKGK